MVFFEYTGVGVSEVSGNGLCGASSYMKKEFRFVIILEHCFTIVKNVAKSDSISHHTPAPASPSQGLQHGTPSASLVLVETKLSILQVFHNKVCILVDNQSKHR